MSVLKNIHLYPSTGLCESRIKRSCAAAKKSGRFSGVSFFAIIGEGNDEFDVATIRPVAKTKHGYILASIFRLMRTGLCINVHNWYMLLPAIISAMLFRNVIIYEPHEFESGTSYIGPVAKRMCVFLERLYFRFFHSLCTVYVGEVQKEKYVNLYGDHVSQIIRSLPTIVRNNDSLVSNARLDTGCYVGLLTEGRGIKLYLDLIQRGVLKTFYFVGHGPLKAYLLDLAERDSRIMVLDSMREEKLYNFLCERRPVCFSVMDTRSVSNRCASPNKFYIYLYANCPIVYSDYGDQALIGRDLRVGQGIKTIDEQTLEVALGRLQQEFTGYSLPDAYFAESAPNLYYQVFKRLA